MNLDYWEEQIKATLVTAAHLAVPVEFTLAATPPGRAISPGGVATFTIEVQPTGGFTATVNLVADSPSPSLMLDLFPAAVVPPGQATLTLTDTHTTKLVPGLWYTVPITATARGITQTTSVRLLVGGVRFYLPIVLRERLVTGENYLCPRVQDYGYGAIALGHFRETVPQKRPADWPWWGFLLRRHLILVFIWGRFSISDFLCKDKTNVHTSRRARAKGGEL
jgi:hypothetical protein